MKNMFSLLFAAALAMLTACQSDNSTQTSTDAAGNAIAEGLKPSPVNNGETLPAPRSEAPTVPQNPEGTFATPVLPDLSNPKVALLLRSFWVAEYWVNHGDASQNKPNQGRWWRFSPDGTFVTGQWEKTYTQGSWVLHTDGTKEFLHMDAADNNFDMEFDIQGVSQLQDYMSWVGTQSYGLSRIAVKATSLLSVPTKAQFGVAE